jgi:hypothetical protein
VKSRAEWFVKMRRGYHDVNLSQFDDAKFGEGFRHADHNEVFDDSALRFLDGTRAVLRELGS